MGRIKICFVGDDVRPPWNHASSILTKRLIECLSPAVEITLTTTTPEKRQAPIFEGCETIYVDPTGVRAIDALKLGIAAERSSAQIFHAIGTNALLFSPACKLSGATGAVVRQIFTPYDQSDRLTSPLRRLVNNGFIRAYAFTTPWMGRWRKELGSSTMRFVLRPPINCGLYRPLQQTGDGPTESDRHDLLILYMGPLWKSRFPTLSVLRALEQLSKRGLDPHLTVVASSTRTTDSQVGEIVTLSKSIGVERHVSVRRKDLTESERVRAYNDADIVFFPYVGPDPEQLADPPLGILESMACGRPVLTTGVLSIPEVVRDGENGFLMSTPSPDNICDGVQRALDSQKDRLGPRARSTIMEQFSYSAVKAEALKLYETLS